MKSISLDKSLSNDSFLTVDIFVLIVAIVTAIFYFIITIEFDYNIESILKVLTIAFFILLFPRFYQYTFKNNSKTWWTNESSLSFYSLLILTINGYFVPIINLNFFPLFSILGIFFAFFSFYKFFKLTKITSSLIFLLISFLMGGWFATTFYSNNIKQNCGELCSIYSEHTIQGMWHNPLLKEWLIIQKPPISSEIISDYFFHSSIMNMIKTYGIPSFGTDGLVYFPYHFGSHWIFAQISNVVNLNGIDFYLLAFPIIFIPFFLKHILYFSIQLRKRIYKYKKEKSLRFEMFFWLLFFISFVNIIPYKTLQEILPWWNKIPIIMNSESYTLSLTFLLIFLSIGLDFFLKYNLLILTLENIIFIILITPFFIGLISITKISTGFVLIGLILYFYFRCKLYKYKIINFALLEIIFIYIFVSYLTSSHMAKSVNFEIFAFVKERVGNFWKPFYYILGFIWTWIFIIFKFFEIKTYNIYQLKNAFLKYRFLDIEFILVITIVGNLPGLLFDIPFGNSYYFSNISSWIALSFVLANSSKFIKMVMGK